MFPPDRLILDVSHKGNLCSHLAHFLVARLFDTWFATKCSAFQIHSDFLLGGTCWDIRVFEHDKNSDPSDPASLCILNDEEFRPVRDW